MDENLYQPAATAIVDRLAFGGAIIETRAHSYRPAHTLNQENTATSRASSGTGKRHIRRPKCSRKCWYAQYFGGTAAVLAGGAAVAVGGAVVLVDGHEVRGGITHSLGSGQFVHPGGLVVDAGGSIVAVRGSQTGVDGMLMCLGGPPRGDIGRLGPSGTARAPSMQVVITICGPLEASRGHGSTLDRRGPGHHAPKAAH
jgi:hypothetical protein